MTNALPDPGEEKDEDHPSLSEGSSSEAPTQVPLTPEVLEKLPPHARRQVDAFFASMMSVGPVPNPIAQKVTPEHIGQLIQGRNKETELHFADRRDSRRFAVGLFAFSSLLTSVLIVALAVLGQKKF